MARQARPALRRQEKAGGVERRHLVAEGLDADICTLAIAAEWALKPDPGMWPGMAPNARKAAAKVGAGAKRVRTYAAIWDAARELLQHEDVTAVSGRLILADADDGGRICAVVRTGLNRIAAAWRENSQDGREKPTFIMDATLPALPILQAFYPDVEVVADIEATTPHARVRQILGAPTSANKLHRSATDRNHEAVRRAILLRWVEAGRPPDPRRRAGKDRGMAEGERPAGRHRGPRTSTPSRAGRVQGRRPRRRRSAARCRTLSRSKPCAGASPAWSR